MSRLALICGLTTLPAVVLPQPAPAAIAHVEVRQSGGGSVAKLIYRAGSREANKIEVCATAKPEPHCSSAEQAGRPTAYVIVDLPGAAATMPGPGCHRAFDQLIAGTRAIRCPIPEGSRPTGTLIDLGDRRDQVSVYSPTGALYVGAVTRGGKGNDSLSGAGMLDGGSGADGVQAIYAGRRGARLRGGPGDDFLRGGPGGDLIEPGSGRDEIDAGAGADRVRAQDRHFDSIRCGRGLDRLLLNGFDLAVNPHCERIRRSEPPRAIPYGFDYELPEDDFAVPIACPPDIPVACRVVAFLTVSNGLRQRKVGSDRFTLRPGQNGTASITPTEPVSRRSVRLTVRTLRASGPPLDVTKRYRIAYDEGEGDG